MESHITGSALPIIDTKDKKIPIYLYADADEKSDNVAGLCDVIYPNSYFTIAIDAIPNNRLEDFLNAFWDKFAYKMWDKQDNVFSHNVGLMTLEKDFTNIVFCSFYCENMNDFYDYEIYDTAKDMVAEFTV